MVSVRRCLSGHIHPLSLLFVRQYGRNDRVCGRFHPTHHCNRYYVQLKEANSRRCELIGPDTADTQTAVRQRTAFHPWIRQLSFANVALAPKSAFSMLGPASQAVDVYEFLRGTHRVSLTKVSDTWARHGRAWVSREQVDTRTGARTEDRRLQTRVKTRPETCDRRPQDDRIPHWARTRRLS